MGLGMYKCHGKLVEIRDQISGVGSLLPLYGFWCLNSCHKAGQQALVPTEPSYLSKDYACLCCYNPTKNRMFIKLHCLRSSLGTGLIYLSSVTHTHTHL